MTNERLPLITALLYGYQVLNLVVVLWPLLAIKSRRWRILFGAMLAARVLFIADFSLTRLTAFLGRSQPQLLLRALAVSSGLVLGLVVLSVAADVILVVIVLRDRWNQIQYPWTHWAGVAVALWLALIRIGPTVSGSIVLLRTML
jgi:hypothetical protein